MVYSISKGAKFQFLRSNGLNSEHVTKHRETITHLLSACGIQAVSAYIHRHNTAWRVLYYNLWHYYGIDETSVLPYVPGDIECIVENERAIIYQNYSFSTLRILEANTSSKKAMNIMEISAPVENIVVRKEGDKQTKYQNLLFELRRLDPHCFKI